MTGLPFSSGLMPPEFHISPEVDCPYLPGKKEKMLYLTAQNLKNLGYLSQLNRAGFRRTRSLFYQNICTNCTACQPIRVLVREWVAPETLRRIMNKNQDLTISNCEYSQITHEHYQLARRYLDFRHHDPK